MRAPVCLLVAILALFFNLASALITRAPTFTPTPTQRLQQRLPANVVRTQPLLAASAAALPAVKAAPPLTLTGSQLFLIARAVVNRLPLPLRLIAGILATLSILVLIEDSLDALARLVKKLTPSSSSSSSGGAGAAEQTALVRKPFIPTRSSVAVRFLQSGSDPVVYGAEVGSRLSQVAEDAAVQITYDCRKGQCGTCSVKVGSKWIKTCQASIPMPSSSQPGEVFEVIVPKAAIKSSKFFSPRSFLDGVWNNALGMVGFVGQMRKADDQFQKRLAREKALAEKVAAAKKAAGAGAAGAAGTA